MTQPVGFNSSLNYTPYDPDLDRTDGAGGSGGHSSGAEGAGNTSNAQPAVQEGHDCTTELVKMVGSCGGAILAGRALTPLALPLLLNCLASVSELAECRTESEAKLRGQ